MIIKLTNNSEKREIYKKKIDNDNYYQKKVDIGCDNDYQYN